VLFHGCLRPEVLPPKAGKYDAEISKFVIFLDRVNQVTGSCMSRFRLGRWVTYHSAADSKKSWRKVKNGSE